MWRGFVSYHYTLLSNEMLPGSVIHQYFLGPFKFCFVSLRDEMSFEVSQKMSYERLLLVSRGSLPPNSVAFHIVFSFGNTYLNFPLDVLFNTLFT